MAISLLSPQVDVTEIDNSQYVVPASTSRGAAVIAAGWGPVNSPQLIDNEGTLVDIFGKPNDQNYKNWLAASNFLSYSGQMFVARMDTRNQFNANSKGATGWKAELVNDKPVYDENGDQVMAQVGLKIGSIDDYTANHEVGSSEAFGEFAARYPGSLGNSLFVTYADAASFDNWTYTDENGVFYDWRLEFGGKPGTSGYARARGGKNDEIHLLVVDMGGRITGQKGSILERYQYLSKATDARDNDGASAYYRRVLRDQSQYVYCISEPEADNLIPSYQQTVLSVVANAEAAQAFIENNEVKAGDKIITSDDKKVMVATRMTVTEEDGDQYIRAVKTVFVEFADLEQWVGSRVLRKDENTVYAVSKNNDTIEFTEVALDEDASWTKTATDHTFQSMLNPVASRLSGGTDDFNYTEGDELATWDKFANREQFNVSLLVTGAATATVAKYIIENICEKRMDCVAFVSPTTEDRGPILGSYAPSEADIATLQALDEQMRGGSAIGSTTSLTSNAELKILSKTLEYRQRANFNVNSSYGHLDSGWKYQYDKFNDCNRWVPLNGDIAGLYALTDMTNNPWTVAAGYNRGQIRNVIKLNYSPNKAHRDLLYPAQINPVVTFTGAGTILYGSKSLLTKPSAFDRLNVRRLFIYLETTISEAVKYLLFELNNASTRSYAASMVDPILRNICGEGGIYSYRVVCDESNNPADIIDNNQLVMDIYVSPAKSIDFISLHFVCERTGGSSYSEG